MTRKCNRDSKRRTRQADGRITAYAKVRDRQRTKSNILDADFDRGNGLEERLYYQQDANFNVTALIEPDGDVVERVVYDAYGARTFLSASFTGPSGSSTYLNDILFQGGRQDTTTGLINFQRRDLSTGLGRWVQQDPLAYVDGMNLYEFVTSNPVDGLDPTGLKEKESPGIFR